ncbi:TPA: CBS domain-containing protein [archaeon]|uniref:CBS domain-containing protein n=1 Tax=Candidatus Naiadarchaeum limnaeum TaxID=2756139 RepID=A0A832VAA1_9ARCH|nr:CBS domain-containing protein [Candidatus Naiadarchaeum limnaeum]
MMTTVADVMTRNVMGIEEKESIMDALKKMKKLRIGCLVVVDGKEAIGILTDADILFKVVSEEKNLSKITVGKIMSKPLITISPDASIDDAAKLMTMNRIKKLPVVGESGKLIGIITATDLIAHSPEFSDILLQMKPPGGATFGA